MSDSLTLSVPKEITYAIRRKVFPRKKERSDNVSVTETTFSVFNYGDDNLTDLSFKHEPLISEHDGSHRSAKLILLPESDADGEQENDSHTILAGGQIRFSLSVTGELGPGIYRSNIRVRKKPDNEAITIPVVVSVREHWVYAFVALLLGLLVFGILALLSETVQIAEMQADILRLNRSLHEFRENYHPFHVQKIQADEVENMLVGAWEALGRQRSGGIKDWRMEDAGKYLEQAEKRLNNLKAKSENKLLGQAAVDELGARMKRFESTTTNLITDKAFFLSRENSEFENWDNALVSFLERQKEVLLSVPFEAILRPMTAHVSRTQLAFEGGEGIRAQKLALKVMKWLNRSARLFERNYNLLQTFRVFADEALFRVGVINRILQQPYIDVSVRDKVSGYLDDALEHLQDEAGAPDLEKAYVLLLRAENYLFEELINLLLKEYKKATTVLDAQTRLDDILAARVTLEKDLSQDALGGAIKVLGSLWEKKARQCESETIRDTLFHNIGILKRLGPTKSSEMNVALDRLEELWETYFHEELSSLEKKYIGAFCSDYMSYLAVRLDFSRELLRLLQPHQFLEGEEENIERLNSRLKDYSQTGECVKDLLEFEHVMAGIGEKMMEVLMVTYNSSPALKLQASRNAQAEAAEKLARQIMREEWPVGLALLSDNKPLYAGTRIGFSVTDLNPAWGSEVSVLIDFGDRSPVYTATAEDVRQKPIVFHEYDMSESYNVHLAVVTGPVEGKRGFPGEGVLGQDSVQVFLAPSPISGARQLSGMFFNVRFAIALIIGIVIQLIRFYNEKEPFGAKKRDYVEAFALGVGVDAGVRGIVEVIGNIGLPV